MSTEPYEYHAEAVLRNGETLVIRAIHPDDKDRLHEHFLSLGQESVYNRFFGPKLDLTAAELRQLTELDFDHHVGLFAVRRREGREEVLGVARYVVIEGTSPRRAEMAVAVSDACQNLGVGTVLLEHLARIAVSRGVRAFEADVLGANNRMMHMIRRSGLPMDCSRNGGVLHVSLRVPDDARLAGDDDAPATDAARKERR
jgi:GNAT superfamily N-acetyltransferase